MEIAQARLVSESISTQLLMVNPDQAGVNTVLKYLPKNVVI
jgi:hypothetical protein